jgi:hypothetical protein
VPACLCRLTTLRVSRHSSLHRESDPAQPPSPAPTVPGSTAAVTGDSLQPQAHHVAAARAATRATATGNAIAARPARSSLRHPTALLRILCAASVLPRRESLAPGREGTRSPTLDAPPAWSNCASFRAAAALSALPCPARSALPRLSESARKARRPDKNSSLGTLGLVELSGNSEGWENQSASETFNHRLDNGPTVFCPIITICGASQRRASSATTSVAACAPIHPRRTSSPQPGFFVTSATSTRTRTAL